METPVSIDLPLKDINHSDIVEKKPVSMALWGKFPGYHYYTFVYQPG
jgi:hypothetical protein